MNNDHRAILRRIAGWKVQARHLLLRTIAVLSVAAGGALVVTPVRAEHDKPTAHHHHDRHRSPALVRVQEGWLRGISDEEHRAEFGPDAPGGAPVDEFLGVPFAEAPTGERRFAPPARLRSWRGVREAKTLSVFCAQQGLESQEDCLQLNIYRPRVVDRDLPVLFDVPGGAFMVGGGEGFRGRKLASEQRVIVVSINYRLNAFGFLRLPGAEKDPELPQGNQGLRDQQAALNWVRRNIRHFGGDPNRITLSGQSAGATSVCAHLASPPVRDKFAAAASFSGPCTATEPEVMEERSAAVVEAVGCADAASVLACLRGKTQEELLNGLGWFQAELIRDPELLPVLPQDAIHTGEVARVPMMLGLTSDEVRIFLTGDYPLAAEDYSTRLEAEFPGLGAEVAAEYPATSFEEPFYGLSQAISDVFGNCTARSEAAALAQWMPLFFYEFSDPAAPAPVWMPVPEGMSMGPTHSSDGPYIFDRENMVQPDAAPFTAQQRRLGRQMRRALAALMRRGTPSPRFGPYWPEYNSATDLTMLLEPGGIHVIDDHFERHHCGFWEGVGF